MASAKQKLRDTFGTAPRRVSATRWVTRSGRVLSPAGARYWEAKYQSGEYDARGHNLLKTLGFVGASEVANQRARERNAALSARQPRLEAAKPLTGTTRTSRAEKYARLTGDTTPLFDIARETGKLSGLLKKSAVVDNSVTRDLNAIVGGFPRAAWLVGRDTQRLVQAPFFAAAEGSVDPLKGAYTGYYEDLLKPIGKAYATKYGEPIVHGDFGQLLHNIGETPVSSLLDLWAGAGAVSQLAKVGRFAGAEGSLAARAREARAPRSRTLPTGSTSVDILASPNPLAEAVQRVIDRMSVRAQAAKDAGAPIPGVFTSDVRAAKQTYRNMASQGRRLRAGAAEALGAIQDVPRKARTALWYDLQVPPEARGAPAVEAAAARLRELADTTLEQGTAFERFKAAQPTDAYTRALTERDRLQQQITRMLKGQAGEALRPRPRPGVGASDALVWRGGPQPEPAAGPIPLTPTPAPVPEAAATGIEATRARFAEVDAQFQALVDRAQKGMTSAFTKAEKEDIYSRRATFNKQNYKATSASGRARGFEQHKPKTPGEQARDLTIERLYRFAENAPDSTPGIQGLRDLLDEHQRLSHELMQHEDFAGLPTRDEVTVEAPPPTPELVQASRIAAKAVARPARQPIGPRVPTVGDLRGALAVANDRVRRLSKPRLPVRDLEAERAEAVKLLTAAAKVEKSGAHGYDPKAIEAADRLMADRTQIMVDAGKLDPEEAAARTGLMARELGFEPSGGEVYVGHRFRRGFRARLGFPTSVEGRARTPEGIGQENTLRAFQSGRVLTDPRELAVDWQSAQAYRVQNEIRDYLGKVGDPIPEAGPNRGWYVIDPEGQKLPRRWKNVDPVAKARAEGVRVEASVAQDIEDYVNNYIGRSGTPQGDELLAKARDAGHEPVQVSPDVVHRLISTRNPGEKLGIAGEVFNVATDLTKASLIYFNPGYIPANLVGNTLFGVVHQGAALPANTVRAIRLLTSAYGKGLSRAERVELSNRLRGEIGPGPTVAVTGGSGGPIHQLIQHVARVEGFVADDVLRLAGWVREARKAGVKTPRQQLEFLRKAEKRDPGSERLANLLEQKMADAMGDFNRMGPQEKLLANRYLFVWAWIRAASRYPFTTVRDYPVRSALIARASVNASQDKTMDTPALPSWLSESFKVGPGRYVNPRSTSNINTFPDLVGTVVDALAGRNNAKLLDVANPVLRIGADVGKGQDRFGREVGALGALTSAVENLSPAASTIREALNPSSASKVYGPQTVRSVLERRFGRGAIPFKIDEREAYKQARKNMSREQQVKGDATWLQRDYAAAASKAKLGKLPRDVKAALDWRTYRELNRVQFKKKHPELYEKDSGLANLAADLNGLVAAKAITKEQALLIYQQGWAYRQHPATSGRLSGLQGNVNQQLFHQGVLTEFDARLKRGDVTPPRRH